MQHASLMPLFIAPYIETVSARCHWKKLDRVEEKGRRPRHLPPPPPPPPPRQLHQRFIKKPTMLPLILSQPSHCVATLVILESPVSDILCPSGVEGTEPKGGHRQCCGWEKQAQEMILPFYLSIGEEDV